MRQLQLRVTLLIFIGLPLLTEAATFTWDGSNSNWNDPANWIVSGMGGGALPGPGDDVIIDDPGDPEPVLPGVTQVNSISISNGASLDLSVWRLEVLSSAPGQGLELDGAVLRSLLQGEIVCATIVEIRNTLFEGDFEIRKSGGAVVLSGDNTCTGVFEFVQEAGAGSTVFGAAAPDLFQGLAAFTNRSIAPLALADGSSSTLYRDGLILQNTGSGGISLGSNGGAAFVVGALMPGSGFNSGPLSIRNLAQLGAPTNGAFSPTTFTAENCTFRGGFTCTATVSIQLRSCQFADANVFTAPDIEEVAGSQFSLSRGSTVFTKLSGDVDIDAWAGGNTFGDVTIANAGTNELRTATLLADTYRGDATFQQVAGQLKPCYEGDNLFEGNISTAGSASPVFFGLGLSGSVVIAGDQAQQFTAAAAPRVTRLEMSTTGNGSLTLNGDLRITESISFANGVLFSAPGSRLLLLDGAGVGSAASGASYVDGPVQKAGLLPGMAAAFDFPIGNGGVYAPIRIPAPGSATDAFTASYIRATPPNAGNTVAPVDHISTVEYWSFEGNAATTLEVNWGPNSGLVTDYTALILAQLSGVSWISLGGTPTGDNSSGTLSVPVPAGKLGFITLASTLALPENPLPVELLYFRALAADRQVDLEWATAAELNHDAFLIERSADGSRFETIAELPGDGRDRYERKDYRFTDEAPLPGLSYYRLKQVDRDGSFAYSNLQSVSFSPAAFEEALTIFPNPARDRVTVLFPDAPETARLRLFSSAGQELPVQAYRQDASLEFSTSHLPPGLYSLQLSYAGKMVTRRLVIQQ